MLRIYSISLGCPKNLVDTEKTLGGLEQLRGGLLPVDAAEKADLVFINTCAFIAPAVDESVRVILETADRLANLPPERRPLLAAAGCLVGRFGGKDLAPDLPEVDLLLESRDLPDWPARLSAALEVRAGGHPGSPLLPHPISRLLSTGPSYAWLKVSEGCRQACSFCVIPAIRGSLRSAPAASLREEAVRLLDQGVREIILVAQDLTSWGTDLPAGERLPGLLRSLLSLRGLDRLRLMYLYPSGLTDDLLRFLQDAGPPFVPYFDIPLQHAAPGILGRMGRPFAGDPRAVVDRVRKFFPQAALRTSLMVGFPGETEADFDLLCRFVREIRFTHLGVFAFSPEEGTPAALLKGRVRARVSGDRRSVLMGIQKEISGELLAACLGQRLSILVDRPQGEWPGLHLGRAWFQAPEADGVTYVSGPGVAPGLLVEAEITETSSYDLVALTDEAGSGAGSARG
ncbi:MAG: 30S ribosomal protein S12 methylthiotransferase RimO [Desulfovibrio sp.]|jgi:tRNA-2-methylthio-N6-dimethylallyladenosine synthase/ribosomal protein S12 methylthiotransferase|nr:30S ribosomal protein S12 methylthiotransferase RimO [Desulfovibrio sp.]